MGFQTYITCIMAFFTPFNYFSHFFSFILTLSQCYSTNFNMKLKNERKEASAYHVISKEVKNHILRRNWIFRHTFCMNNPHWQSCGVIIFLCKYFIVISDIMVGTYLHVLFLLVAVILSGLPENPRRNKDWVTEKRT